MLTLCALSLALAVPPLAEQWRAWGDLAPRLDGRNLDERLALFDTPGYPVAQAIAANVPEEGCVMVAAYAGPDAVNYYQARLPYFLYPRRVHLRADSGVTAEDCRYLAVFRDTRQNLAASPFSGTWEQETLDARTGAMERVHGDTLVTIYSER